MKRMIVILLAAALMISLTACGSSTETAADADTDTVSETVSETAASASSEAEQSDDADTLSSDETGSETGSEETETVESGVLMNTAAFTGTTQLENNNDYYGGYFYKDKTEDGNTIIINCCFEDSYLSSDVSWEEYAEEWAETVCGYEVSDFTIEKNDENSERMSYPVYYLTWLTGENEDTRIWNALLIGTDGYDYMYAFGTMADFEEEMREVFYDAFDQVTLEY